MGNLERVKDCLKQVYPLAEIRQFDSSTKNSTLAARALGCTTAEIAKSVVFKGKRLYVIVISGDRKVDTEKLGVILGTPIEVATAEEVGVKQVIGLEAFPHFHTIPLFPCC